MMDACCVWLVPFLGTVEWTFLTALLSIGRLITQEVDLLHVTDGDRGNMEAYMDSMERLLDEQDQELERCVRAIEGNSLGWAGLPPLARYMDLTDVCV